MTKDRGWLGVSRSIFRLLKIEILPQLLMSFLKWYIGSSLKILSKWQLHILLVTVLIMEWNDLKGARTLFPKWPVFKWFFVESAWHDLRMFVLGESCSIQGYRGFPVGKWERNCSVESFQRSSTIYYTGNK